MWTFLAVCSSFLLGLYDAAKKQALKKNGVLAVLLVATALSTLFVSPFLRFGPLADHLRLALKAVLVTASWISGMVGLKLLPLTTVSLLKGSRPMFVVLFSVILFGELLSWMQWAGVVIVLGALFLLGRTSRGDAPVQVRKAGFVWMGVSIVTGVLSALYDKRIMAGMDPLFVQSWTDLYITVLLALCCLVRRRLSPCCRGVEGPHQRPCEALQDVADIAAAEHPTKRSEVGSAPGGSRGATGEIVVPHGRRQQFQWDWWLLVVALLITGADALYFFALKQPGALLSVISVIRRAAVIITFICGAVFFKEGRLRAKGLNLMLMAAGVALLLVG